MKLNKQQINALAYTLKESINSKIEKSNKETQIKANSDSTFQNKITECKKLQEKFRALKLENTPYYLNEFLKYNFNALDNKCKKQKLVGVSDIEHDLILASIDNKDLESLKTAILNKYK
jgi:hypothetical protein